MPFRYKTVLLIGATAGIGAALADKLVEEGVKVIAVGRRQERLDAFVNTHGIEKAASVKFDMTDADGLDAFVQNVTTCFPEIDCLFINAGIQYPVDFTKPTEIQLANVHKEINTNFTAVVDLTIKFLPYLLKLSHESSGASIIYTSSTLAWVPASGLPIYSSTKAALNSFILCLREQLRNNSSSSDLKVIDLSPPLVQTELHDYLGIEKGRAFGMPLDKFTEIAWKGLATNTNTNDDDDDEEEEEEEEDDDDEGKQEEKDEVIIGTPGPPPIDPDYQTALSQLVSSRRSLFAYTAQLLRGGSGMVRSYVQFQQQEK